MEAPRQTKLEPKGLAVAPLWLQPLRWLAVVCVYAYYRTAYRIRSWGRLPARRGPTLIVINHQHDIESAVIVATLSVTGFAWRYPIFTVSSRRMWEPNFLAQRIPWIRPLIRGLNFGSLFSAIGMQPIENELHSKPLLSLAYDLLQRHGDVALAVIFRDRILERLPAHMVKLSDVLKPANAEAAGSMVSLSDLREPYRQFALASTRQQLAADSAHFERLVRDGASLFLAPEGFYTTDGKMQRLRGLLPRLAPLAQIWLAGISYDPFVGRRLGMMYRVQAAIQGMPLDIQLKRLRPVTTSALLGYWLHDGPDAFGEEQVVNAVELQLRTLPPELFLEPGLLRRPRRLVQAALLGMCRLHMLQRRDGRYALTTQRMHPQFPNTPDMIAYQANFHKETLEGARQGKPQ